MPDLLISRKRTTSDQQQHYAATHAQPQQHAHASFVTAGTQLLTLCATGKQLSTQNPGWVETPACFVINHQHALL
jgi:hypothetical protein